MFSKSGDGRGHFKPRRKDSSWPREIRTRREMIWFYLVQWFSNWGPWTSNISIVWELVRNANFCRHPTPTKLETLEVGPGNLGFNKPSRWLWCTSKLENHWPSALQLCLRVIYSWASELSHTDLALPVTLGPGMTNRMYLMGYFRLIDSGCLEILYEGFWSYFWAQRENVPWSIIDLCHVCRSKEYSGPLCLPLLIWSQSWIYAGQDEDHA